MADQFDVVEHVLQLLQHGRRSSTYKHAVLIGLMDLCLEQTDALGWPPSMITTRQLAEKVIELYWPQVRPWEEGILLQNNDRQAAILRHIQTLREEATLTMGVGAGATTVRLRMPKHYERLVQRVEWTLIEMPLPKLQRVASQDTGWLYRISWGDGAELPKRAEVRAYQEGHPSSFDNRILLRSEVAMAFVRLYGLLRPFVEQQWARDVAQLNRLEESRLRTFLFGSTRTQLTPVRRPLLDLQDGQCFYCKRRIAPSSAEVDHFIPWSRHSDDSLQNLVIAHPKCNNDKSDFLAGAVHLRQWCNRNREKTSELHALSQQLSWDVGSNRTLGAARALYLQLPTSARLWVGVSQFEVADPMEIQQALT